MEEILETVMQKLAQIPELRWIDLNVGQMSVQNPPVDYPCALVDITAIDHTTAGVQRQIGDLQLEIELYFIVRSPANTLAPGHLREQAFEYFAIVRKIYATLQNLSGENFTGLTRVRTTRNKNYYPRALTLTFRTTLEDRSAIPKYRKLTDIKPDIQIQK